MTYSKIKAIKNNETNEIISEEFLKEIYHNAQMSLLDEILQDLNDFNDNVLVKKDYIENKKKTLEYYRYCYDDKREKQIDDFERIPEDELPPAKDIFNYTIDNSF